MLLKLAGGRVYDPINGIDGEVRDLWIEDGRIVAGPAGRAAGGRDDRPRRPGRHARRHRPAQPYRRRQGQHRPDAAARGAPRAPSSTATARCRCGSGHCQPVDLHHRLRLCPHGLHHGVRAGDAAGQRPPGAPGDGRRPAARQRRLRPARQRRPVPAAGQGRRRPGRDPRLCRLDPARHPGAGGQDRQPRRHQRLQVQRPQARPRRGGPASTASRRAPS